MADTADIDLPELAEMLRGERLVSDAEVIAGLGPGTATVLIVPQGFRLGHVMRELVMRLAGRAAEQMQVALVREIPRDPHGSLDRQEAEAAMRRPGVVYRYERPATGIEHALTELVAEVLPGVRTSMTDNLLELGADSIAVAELTTLIQERLGAGIDQLQVFSAGSLRELAAVLPGLTADPGRA